MRQRIKYIIGVIGICIGIGTMLVVPGALDANSAYADENEDSGLSYSEYSVIKNNVFYKVLYSNLDRCYTAMNSEIGKENNYEMLYAFDTDIYFSSEALGEYIHFPYGIDDKGRVGASFNNNRSCPELIMGWNDPWWERWFGDGSSSEGILGYNQNAWVPKASITTSDYDATSASNANFLKSAGYEEVKEEAPATERCFYFKLTVTDELYDYMRQLDPGVDNVFETVDYCVSLYDSGNVKNITYLDPIFNEGHLRPDDTMVADISFDGTADSFVPAYYRAGDSGTYLQADLSGVQLRLNSMTLLQYFSINQDIVSDNNDEACHNAGYVYCASGIRALVKPGEAVTFDELTSRFKNLLEKAKDNPKLTDPVKIFKSATIVEEPREELVNTYYKKKTNGVKDFISYFLKDVSAYNEGTFTEAEAYVLYYTYLDEYYHVTHTSASACDNSVEVAWWDYSTGKFQDAFLCDPDEDLSDKQQVTMAGFVWSRGSANGAWRNWHEIAELMAKIDIEEAFGDDVVVSPIADPDLTTGTTTGSEAKSCTNSSGAQSLGWILCPVLDIVAGAAQDMYDNFIEPALQVEPTLFNKNGSENGTYKGWEYFRNFANILFAIFLLVVIFSQLTGYGIDNYGIKKILPKLIVVAVMVNLSYFICTALVDLSNILGNSLQTLFNNLPGGPKSTMDIWGKLESGLNTGIVTAVLGGIGTAAIWAAVATEGWTGILIGLIFAAIAALIGYLFLFVLLSARQIAIVVLVVISPLAIICYALPNTKNLFDKYKKIGMTLLMVYPVAGILVGGGDYVSRVMLSNGVGSSFSGVLTAMLASIVPVFFIPTLLRGSMSMMGQLGTKISGFGKRAQDRVGGLKKPIMSSDPYKRVSMAENRWRAGLDENGQAVKTGKFRKLLSGGKIGMAAAGAAYARGLKEQNEIDRWANGGAEAAYTKVQTENEEALIGDAEAILGKKTNGGATLLTPEGLKAELAAARGDIIKEKALARLAGGNKVSAANLMNALKGADAGTLAAMSREMTTGKNAGVYKATSPVMYDYMSKVNSGGVGAGTSYTKWSTDADNIRSALDANVTKRSELTAMKGGELGELIGQVQILEAAGGKENMATASGIRRLAQETLANWDEANTDNDRTKKERLITLAGSYAPKEGEVVNLRERRPEFERGGAADEASTTSQPVQPQEQPDEPEGPDPFEGRGNWDA